MSEYHSTRAVLALLLAAGSGSACRDGERVRPSSGFDPASAVNGSSSGGASTPEARVGDGRERATGLLPSGDGGSSRDTSLPALGYSWLDAPEAWTAAAEVGPCRPSSAIMDRVDFPGTEWTECGAGCRTLKPVAGTAPVIVDDYRSGLRVSDGEAKLFLSMGIMLERGVSLLGLFDYDADLKPVALLKQTSRGCIDRFLSRQSPFTVGTVVADPEEPGLEMYVGRIQNDSSGAVDWMTLPVEDPAMAALDFDGGWGAVWGEKTFAISAMNSTRQTKIYSAPGNLVQPRSNGQRVVFGEWSSDDGAVRSWRRGDASTQVLAEGPWNVVDLAISETSVVWVGATGSRAWEGTYDTAAFYWLGLTDRANHDVNQRVPLPITKSADKLVTTGKWALLGGCEAEACGVYLVDLVTREVYRRRPTSVPLWRAFAIHDDRLLITEEDADAPPGFFNRIVEYEIPAFIASADKING